MSKVDKIRLDLIQMRDAGQKEITIEELKAILVRYNYQYKWQRRDVTESLVALKAVQFNKVSGMVEIL